MALNDNEGNPKSSKRSMNAPENSKKVKKSKKAKLNEPLNGNAISSEEFASKNHENDMKFKLKPLYEEDINEETDLNANSNTESLGIKEKEKFSFKDKRSRLKTDNLNEIKHVKSSFKSNLFHLQVSEMIKEVSIDYDKTKVIESAINGLKTLLENLEEGEEVRFSLADRYLQDLCVDKGRLDYKFLKPNRIIVLGSYASRTVAKPVQNVDVAIEIPKKCFLDKDYLNHKYHAKRAMYLCYLCDILKKSNLFDDVQWDLLGGDFRKPILHIIPSPNEGGFHTKFVIRLFPSISTNTFELKKLLPNKNALRAALSKDGLPLPTPHYNNSILEDAYLIQPSEFIKSLCDTCQPLREAILLLKVWSNQRNLNDRHGSFNHFLLSLLTCHLFLMKSGKKNASNLSSYQIFRIVMDALANGSIFKEGIFLSNEIFSSNALLNEVQQSFSSAFNFVVCDPDTKVNFASRVSKSSIKEIQHESSLTLKALDDNKKDSFYDVFMTQIDFSSKFDYHIRLSTDTYLKENSSSPQMSDEIIFRKEESNIESLFAKALSDRAISVKAFRILSEKKWSISDGLSNVCDYSMMVGVILNNFDTAFRLIDVGPNAEDVAGSKKFRAFWGSNSELRRFKDGSITEAVVWECPNEKRHLIIENIIRHISTLHLNLKNEQIFVTAGKLDSVLYEDEIDSLMYYPEIMLAFTDLSKILRNVSNLPLSVVSIQPLSPSFRQTSAFFPHPHPLLNQLPHAVDGINKCSMFIQTLEISIQLEISGKWPSKAEAIQKMKLAFCLKIAENLYNEHGIHYMASQQGVDLFFKGFCFRIFILHAKDRSLVSSSYLTKAIANKTITYAPVIALDSHSNPNSNSNSNSKSSLLPQNDCFLKILHSNFISSMQGLHHAYFHTVRIAKRWISCHLFSSVLCEEAIELIVAHLFTSSSPFSPPKTRINGFLRFLDLLHSFDWQSRPLIVSVHDSDLSDADHAWITDHFNSRMSNALNLNSNSTFPAMFIATSYDRECATWTKSSPSRDELKALMAYAKSSAQLLRNLIQGKQTEIWESLFCSPLDIFDVAIIIKKDVVSFPSRTLFHAKDRIEFPAEKKKNVKNEFVFSKNVLNKGLSMARKKLLVGLDPIAIFVQSLKLRFGTFVHVRYDAYGGDVVCLSWNRNAFHSLPLKRHLVHMQKPIPTIKNSINDDDIPRTLSLPNLNSIIDDIKMMGEGMIQYIHVNSKSKTQA